MRKLLFIVLIFLPHCMQGQVFRVLSENSGMPIENVAVFNTSRARVTMTDSMGTTGVLPFLPQDTIVFQHPSYNTIIYPYSELKGQQNIYLVKRNILIDEFIISASKSREQKRLLPYKVSVLESRTLELNTAQTAADILLETGNIMVQKTQAGGGSPILRGFEANKILLVVDGVRMNNAIYRSGHLQNSITIDNSILSRTEVIFGPGSLIYGSDALGGVIHYYTKDPEYAPDDQVLFKGSAYSQYSTANNGFVGHLHFNVGGQNLSSLTSVTYKDFGDIRIGKNRNLFYGDWGKIMHYAVRVEESDSMFVNTDPFLQQNTGYDQLDLLHKVRFSRSEFIDWIVNLQFSTSSNIDRLDKLNDYSGSRLKYAEYYYGPQNRLLASVKNVNKNDNIFFSNSTSTLAYQRIDEDRISRRFDRNDRLYQLETVNVISLNFDFLKIWDANNRLNYGYDLIYNNVGSSSHYENIETLQLRPAQTRYPSGGSHTLSSSIYGSYKHIFSDQLVLTGGARYNFSYLSSVFSNPTLPFDTTRIRNGAFTGSASMVYHPTPEWQVNLILSTGYRNPNVDDYGKIRAKDDYIIVPNPDIGPEYTYNAEVGVSRIIEGFLRLDAVAYHTLLTNAIVRTDYSLSGADSLEYDGELYRISANYNANLAQIYGFSLNLVSDFYNNILLKGSFNYTRGKNLTDDVPLGHIPPVFGRVSITYDYKRFRFNSFVHYQGWKLIEDFSPYGEDNQAEATRFGYPSWWTLNLSTNFQISEHLSAQLGIENLLDQFYKPFASGVSAPGRNITFTLRSHF